MFLKMMLNVSYKFIFICTTNNICAYLNLDKFMIKIHKYVEKILSTKLPTQLAWLRPEPRNYDGGACVCQLQTLQADVGSELLVFSIGTKFSKRKKCMLSPANKKVFSFLNVYLGLDIIMLTN
jgi:hypothetical protein